jgi:hypothetical protein
MGIKNSIVSLFSIAIIFCGCSKSSPASLKCENNNIANTNNSCAFKVLPIVDSFALNQNIEINIVLPKSFIEANYGQLVKFTGTEAYATLTIANIDSALTGANSSFDYYSKVGKIYKDTVTNDTEYFRKRNLTVSAFGNDNDSIMQCNFILKPKLKGKFAFYFTFFGAKDFDCTKYKYIIYANQNNQHLNYLAEVNNGYIAPFEKDFVYCFKVY